MPTNIIFSIMALAAVLGFGVDLTGLALGLIDPLFGAATLGLFIWAIFYATAYIKD